MEQGKLKTQLSDEDRNDISLCVSDFETGNHLLRYRKISHKALMIYLTQLKQREPHSEVETEIMEYFNACYDFEAMEEYKRKYLTEKG